MSGYLFRLNFRDTMHLLRRVVREDMRRVYVSPPPYWSGDSPADIVGHVLSRAGLHQLQLQAFDDVFGGRPLLTFWTHDMFPVGLGSKSVIYLDCAQRAQNLGFPWSVALSAAERTAVRMSE